MAKPTTNDLVSLGYVKSFLSITTENADDTLQLLITACSRAFANFANRSFTQATVTKAFNGMGGDTMILTDSPLTAVSSLVINAVPIPASPGVPSPGFFFDDNGTITLLGYRFTRARKNVVITYTYGYALVTSSGPLQVPEDVQQAVSMMVGYIKEMNKHVQMVSENLNGMVVSYSQKKYPDFVKTVIDQYTRRHWMPGT